MASPPDSASSPASVPIHRYLGEASDVRFFNLVKRILLEKHGRQLPEGDLDSYEQDDMAPQNRAVSTSLELPAPNLADEYIDTYFSTIHIAYPFVPRSSFLRIYAKARESGLATGFATSWFAILCTFSPGLGVSSIPGNNYLTGIDGIFALGAFYRSFLGNPDKADVPHEELFNRALLFARACEAERSLNQVILLLTQSFYFLAISKTDR